jgi:hypothetical protein
MRQIFVKDKVTEYKVKVGVSLCLIRHHAINTIGRVEVYLHAVLTSALDGCEWLDSRPGHFIPSERSPQYTLGMKLDWPQSQSGRGGKEKYSLLLPRIEPH